MKKNNSKMCQCDRWCCRVVKKPWDILFLLSAGLLTVYVFIKLAII